MLISHWYLILKYFFQRALPGNVTQELRTKREDFPFVILKSQDRVDVNSLAQDFTKHGDADRRQRKEGRVHGDRLAEGAEGKAVAWLEIDELWRFEDNLILGYDGL